MGNKDNIVPGEVPNFGAIFMSNIGTKKECFRRKLFGLPLSKSNFVLHVKKGMILFLFEFERRQLYGVFRATSNGQINIDPYAFKSSGMNFPAQVYFTSVWNCSPLSEHEFQDAIRDNYYSRNKFNFGLSEDQVCKLMMLFRSKRIPKQHPVRNIWRKGDKLVERDGRSGDHGKNLVRDRIGFVSEEDGHHGLDICKFEDDELIETDDHVYFNGTFVEKANNSNRDREQGNRTVMVVREQEDKRDELLTNYMTQSDDFGDGGTRQAILGNRLDHSLGGLRRLGDAGLHSMGDVNDGHEMQNNLGDIRGATNTDSYSMMDKIKREHDIEDGYRRIFTEPHEKNFSKLGLASNDSKFIVDDVDNRNKDFVDDNNRIQDEYHVLNNFSHSLSGHHFGSPCDNRGSQTIDDGRFFGNETFKSEHRTINEHPPKGTTDGWIKPNYDEDCTFRPTTLTEQHPLFNPRGIKPDYDEDFGFGSLASTSHNSIRGAVSNNDISFSHCKQKSSNSAGNPILEVSEQHQNPFEYSNVGKTYDYQPYSTSCDTAMITNPIPYDPEVPDIRLRHSSYFPAGPSSSPVDNCQFYPSSHEIPSFVSMSKSLPYHSQNEGSTRFFDDPGYASSGKSHHTVSCHETGDTRNRVFKTASREGSQGPSFLECVEMAENVTRSHKSHAFNSSMSMFPPYDHRHLGDPRSKYAHYVSEPSRASNKFFSSDAGLRPRKEDSIHHDKKFSKHVDGTDNKRVSVFARLTPGPKAPRQEQELDTDEQHNLGESVNKVMKMLEKVVSSPVKRTAISASALKQDDDNITVSKMMIMDHHRLPMAQMEPNATLALEVTDGESILQETRLVDFKRRKKTNKNLDDDEKCKESCDVKSGGNTASECLVGSASDMGLSCKRRKLIRPAFFRNESTDENTPLKDDSNSIEAVERSEKVDAFMESVQVPDGCRKSVDEGNGNGNGIGNKNEENGAVPDVFVDGMALVSSSNDNQKKMCGWIEC